MGILCSKIKCYIDYNSEENTRTCYKCGDRYIVSSGGSSLRTSCRYHLYDGKNCLYCYKNLDDITCTNCYHCYYKK